jgi:kynureninase
MQALIAGGVIGDFRTPDIMRFVFMPRYIDETVVTGAIDALKSVVADGPGTGRNSAGRRL